MNKQDLRFLISLGITAPFIWYFLGLFFQSQDCQSLTCYSNPDIFQHSVVYDLVFLRGGYKFWNSHWITSLMIPVLYFVILAITRNAGLSLISTIFYGVYHEFSWAMGSVIVNYNSVLIVLGSIWLFFLYGILIVLAFKFCKKIYWTKTFLILSMFFWIYLFVWYLTGYHVSLSGLTKTVYYNDFLTNLQEIGSWIVLFAIFSINAFIFARRNKISKVVIKKIE